MRFVIGLMLGMTLGASLGLLAAPQRGGETIRIIRERIQPRDGTDPAATVILILVFVFGLLAAASGAFGFFFPAAALTVLARRAFSLFFLAFVVFFVLWLL